jgi:soluble cytochrome b562
VLVVLSLVACGGDRLSKREYEEKVRSEYAEVQEAFRATGAAYGRPDLAEKIEAAQAELREAADALEETKPPEEVEAENQQIVSGMRRYAESLDRLRNAAERGDLAVIEDATARIAENEAVEQIAEAAERMKFKGYDLGPIAEE